MHVALLFSLSFVINFVLKCLSFVHQFLYSSIRLLPYVSDNYLGSSLFVALRYTYTFFQVTSISEYACARFAREGLLIGH